MLTQLERTDPDSIFGRPVEVRQYQKKEITEAEVALRQQIVKEEEEEVSGVQVVRYRYLHLVSTSYLLYRSTLGQHGHCIGTRRSVGQSGCITQIQVGFVRQQEI